MSGFCFVNQLDLRFDYDSGNNASRLLTFPFLDSHPAEWLSDIEVFFAVTRFKCLS